MWGRIPLGWSIMAQVRCGLHRLELEEEGLSSEGAAEESWMGGQHWDAGTTTRGGVGWQGGMLSKVTQCSWPEGFPASTSWIAWNELANMCRAHVQPQHYMTAHEENPALECRTSQQANDPHHMWKILFWFTVIQHCFDNPG